MTVVIPAPEPKRGGRPVGSRGNGKTHRERIDRIQRRAEVSQMEIAESRAVAKAQLDADMERARANIAVQIADRTTKQAQRVIATYEAQEVKRAPQIQVDQPFTFWTLTALAGLTFLATALLTADGTIGAAEAAEFAVPAFSFVLFLVFEVATLAFMLMYYMRGSRIDIITGQRIPAVQWFVAMVVASVLTILLSTYHVLDVYDYDWTNIDMWVGTLIRVTASVFFVLISKGIAGVLFAKALDLKQVARIGQIEEDEA